MELKRQRPIPSTSEIYQSENQELPFNSYPHGGREPLKRRPGYNTRQADGPEFMRITGATRCAYCGLNFTASFENWLTMVLDHVIPKSVCEGMGIRKGWVWNYSNAVLACSACNGYCNRYRPTVNCSESMSLLEFYDLRDKIFVERRDKILAVREKEKRFFETKPWSHGKAETDSSAVS
jgi:5-methylcytosine-specific restriction endonuclease McrA